MNYGRSIFHEFVKSQKGQLIVQPRMGFSDFDTMRNGLLRVKQVDGPTIGTITLDSFTRTGDFASARKAIEEGHVLNGYPIVSYGKEINRKLIEGLKHPDFPVQVRHGSSQPEEIFKATIAAGIDALEGGPISYCFPYGKVPLTASINSWKTCSELFAEVEGVRCHLESFGGCMMGQLCPPSMLIAVSLIEVLFFRSFGIRSYSLSLAQGSNCQQDIAALQALRRIAEKYLDHAEEWHIVYYTFMGKFPETLPGTRAIMRDSVRVAKAGGAERLIVKTAMEAHQIPTTEDNIEALKMACLDFAEAEDITDLQKVKHYEEIIFEEANFLIDLLLNLDADLPTAIRLAFEKGYWDVPFCLHPDNHNRVQAVLDQSGVVLWSKIGNIPFPKTILKHNAFKNQSLGSSDLLQMLSFNQIKYDSLHSILMY